jgi:dsRNA-specific ribonuclease
MTFFIDTKSANLKKTTVVNFIPHIQLIEGMAVTTNPLTEVEETLGYRFSNRSLLEKARTRKKYIDLDPKENNFQDEFCLRGDWILRRHLIESLIELYKKDRSSLIQLLCSLKLKNKHADWKIDYENINDCISKVAGDLQSRALLSEIAKRTKLDRDGFIRTNLSEREAIAKEPDNRVLSETFEAVLCAIYVDSNGEFSSVKAVLDRCYQDLIPLKKSLIPNDIG